MSIVVIIAMRECKHMVLQLLEEQTVKDITDFRAADSAREAQLNIVDKAKTLKTPASESIMFIIYLFFIVSFVVP